MTFFNTVPLPDDDLARAENQALTQEEKIMAFFKDRPGSYMPGEIQEMVLPEAPITSVRRAITVLTKKGLLEKSGFQVVGDFGVLNNCWRKKR